MFHGGGGIHVTDAAIGFRRASKHEEMWAKNIAVFWFCRALKKSYIVRDFTNTRMYVGVLLIDGAVKKYLVTAAPYQKEQIQQPGTIFSKFSDKVTVPGGDENCCRYATVVRTPKNPSQGGGLSD